MTVLDRIDNTLSGRCPCGADPRPGSPYCSYDCEPTHVSRDTDSRDHGWLATPMRWRPDLITADPEPDLLPVNAPTRYTGRFTAQLLQHCDRDELHLRLDDGHRWVGLTLAEFGGEFTPSWIGRIEQTWQRLERELGNSRHLVPDDDPWADVMPGREGIYTRAQIVELTAMRPIAADQLVTADDVMPAPFRPLVNQRDAAILQRSLFQEGVHFIPYPSLPVEPVIDREYIQRAIDEAWNGLQQAMEAAAAQMAPVLASVQDTIGRMGPMLETVACEQPPTDPMERALWLRKRRNTGPAPAPLDPRRRRRR